MCSRLWSVVCSVLCFVMLSGDLLRLHGFAPLPPFIPNLQEAQGVDGVAVETAAWSTHYSSALQRAQRENKVLLILFTGSDWCTWCRRLEEEVLDRHECLAALAPYCVFVKLDYPRSNALLSSEEVQQNAALKQRYAVTQFPTVLVVDSKEHVIGKTGYVKGGPSRFNETILHMVSGK